MDNSPASQHDKLSENRDLRVLVVEDSALDAELIVRELRSAGFNVDWTRVETQTNYQNALDTAPDLIVSDYNLPQFDGLRALDLLIERGLEIPFILVSGTIGDEQAVQSIQRGASDYLLKDRLTRLGPAVRSALANRQTRHERKVAIENLHRSEREYRQLVETLPVAMYSTDNSGRITLFNDAAVELWGRRPEPGDIIYDCIVGLFDLDGQGIPTSNWPVAHVLSEHQAVLGAEFSLGRPDGTRRHVLSYPHPLKNEDGAVSGVASLLMDVTELKESEQALRASQVFAQSTIDAVSAQICVLDEGGKIVAVNKAWNEFWQDNHPLPEASASLLGSNYLAVSETTLGPEASDAAAMTNGIRQVQEGRITEFFLEYPCHSPTQQRWFLARVTRFRDDSRNIVIAHEDITERKRTQSVLEANETEQRHLANRLEQKRERLVEAQRVAKVGSWETDLCTLSAVWSEEAHRIHETDPAAFEPTHQGFLARVHPADRLAVETAFMRSFLESCDQNRNHVFEHRLQLPDGRIKYVEQRWQTLFGPDGVAIRAVGTCQDVTERKHAEIKIQRQNRVYAVLSQINALIVRTGDRDELFREACRIVVEEGGFRMAMIATKDPGTSKLLPVATAGKDESLLKAVRDLLSCEERVSQTVCARVLRENKAVVSNDSETDPQNLLRQAYSKAGVRSIAVLPLTVSEEAVGVLALYSNEKDFFHDEEMKLLLGLADDVSFAIDHIQKQERLDYLTSYDQLTGLANLSLFLEHVDHAMRDAANAGQRLALFVIDLERFKNINDSLGRYAGDELLKQVAERLNQHVGESKLAARVGADQFAIALPEDKQTGDLMQQLEAMVESLLVRPFNLNGDLYRIAAKIGAAIFPDDGVDNDVLFKNAEAALKKAKLHGYRHLFYTQKMTESVGQRLNLENQLRQALDNQEFVLHYQPKVNLESGDITSVEALIRWNDPRTGLVSPALFIPVLEETGLIYEVGQWALRQSLKDYLRWRDLGLRAVRIAVNVSPLQLRHPGFIRMIEALVACDPDAARGLEIEITEGMIMDDIEHAISSLDAIRALGISVAIDDFGTGFSSLAYLSKLPINTLKIDRMFVTNMTTDAQGLSLVSTIISLAHSLKLSVVAEGVETDEQARLLHLLKCDEMQGYLFSKPVPTDELEARFLAR